MKDKNIIQQVYQNKYTSQKMVTIPKNTDIEVGDHVLIQKIKIKRSEKNVEKKEGLVSPN